MTPWDPELLARIHHLHLVAKRVVDSLQHGAHRSLQLGSAVEFSDYQEYCPGDPLKNLDWKVLGRTDRLVIRRFEAETELACNLVVDVSGDLGTGSSGRSDRPALDGSKYGHSLCLAASLAKWEQLILQEECMSSVGTRRFEWPREPGDPTWHA